MVHAVNGPCACSAPILLPRVHWKSSKSRKNGSHFLLQNRDEIEIDTHTLHFSFYWFKTLLPTDRSVEDCRIGTRGRGPETNSEPCSGRTTANPQRSMHKGTLDLVPRQFACSLDARPAKVTKRATSHPPEEERLSS